MDQLSFACDAMLGALARWLRFAGFDAFYATDVDDRRLAALARSEGRWLLTCDRDLAARAGPRSLLLHRGSLAAQVAEVRRRLPLAPERARFFTRCPACNGLLAEADRVRVAARVPPFVATTASRFRECPGCGRVFWPGTHAPRIARRLEELFGPFSER